jgi:amidohydrolase
MRDRKKIRNPGADRSRPRPRPDWKSAVHASIWDLRPRLVEVRRDLHRNPELGFRETRTGRIIAHHLRDLGIEVRGEVGQTGIVGLLEGGRPGPTVMWRADMDALPIQEESRHDYASEVDGAMHACGHDGHVAIALGLAELLASKRRSLAGTVKLVFQPAEEGGGGAQAMIRDGVLRQPDVDVALGLHIDNDLDTGTASVSPGLVMAAGSDFTVQLSGRGGHAAAPHLTSDPVVAASFLVTAIHTVVSRQVDPLAPAVITVGAVDAGTAENVIPGEASLRGTIRCFEEETMAEVVGRVRHLSEGVAKAFGVSCEFHVEEGYPATRNDEKITEGVRAVLVEKLGEKALEPMRLLGSEDMAYYLREVPGCYFFLGSRNVEKGCDAPHHAPRFDFDEDVLPLGVQLAHDVVAQLLQARGEVGEERPAGRERARPAAEEARHARRERPEPAVEEAAAAAEPEVEKAAAAEPEVEKAAAVEPEVEEAAAAAEPEVEEAAAPSEPEAGKAPAGRGEEAAPGGKKLLPAHKKASDIPEDELKERRAEDLKGKPLALGDSPWLWRGRKRRR